MCRFLIGVGDLISPLLVLPAQFGFSNHFTISISLA